jgi:hypothetical protein
VWFIPSPPSIVDRSAKLFLCARPGGLDASFERIIPRQAEIAPFEFRRRTRASRQIARRILHFRGLRGAQAGVAGSALDHQDVVPPRSELARFQLPREPAARDAGGLPDGQRRLVVDRLKWTGLSELALQPAFLACQAIAARDIS